MDARREHLKRTVTRSSHDPRSLWRTVKGLLHPNKAPNMHSGLCHSFSSFFKDKVARMRDSDISIKITTGAFQPTIAVQLYTS